MPEEPRASIPDAPTTRLPVRDAAELPETDGERSQVPPRVELGALLAAAQRLPEAEREAFAILTLRALPPESSAVAVSIAAQHLPQNAQQRLRRILPAPNIPLDALPWRVLLGTLLGVIVLSLVATIALLARGNPGAGYILALCLAALGLLGGLLLAALFRQG